MSTNPAPQLNDTAGDATSLIAPSTSSQSLQQHVTCFPRLKETRPNAEHVFDLPALCAHVTCNGRPVVWPDKQLVPMVLLGQLKDAPFTGNTASKYPGQRGKQRSGTHIAHYGPGVMFDIDGMPVKDIEAKVKALGLAYVVYTSYSSASETHDKSGRIKTKGRGRLVLFLDAPWQVDDHERICRVVDRMVLGSAADAAAFSRGQAFYIAGLRQVGQEFYHAASHGRLLSLQAVLARAPRKGRPRKSAGANSRNTGAGATLDEAILQEAREIGAFGCVDIETDWFKMVNAIRRTWPDRPSFALDVADAMSQAAANYKDRVEVETKMRRDDGEIGTRLPSTSKRRCIPRP